MINDRNKMIIKKLSIENTVKVGNATYNHSKLLEELMELGEVLVKKINKIPEKQPPIEKIIEEMGDVLVRVYVLMYQENIEKEVKDRISEKLEMLHKYAKEGKYKGGV